MSKIQDFAQEHFGIQLTKFQIELIEAWTEDKVIVKPPRIGVRTANKVIKAYLKDSLKTPTHTSEEIKDE